MHRSTADDSSDPDIRKCRTGRIPAAWVRKKPLVSHCLNEQEKCRYGRPFAYGCLCRHPRHLDFAAPEQGEQPEEG